MARLSSNVNSIGVKTDHDVRDNKRIPRAKLKGRVQDLLRLGLRMDNRNR